MGVFLILLVLAIGTQNANIFWVGYVYEIYVIFAVRGEFILDLVRQHAVLGPLP